VIVPRPQLVFDQTAHRYTLDGVQLPSVTHVLSAVGLLNYDFLPTTLREEYLARGRAVHQATHDDDLGQLCESAVDPEIWNYLLAWRGFRQDYAFVPHLLEHPVCHPRYQFAGRLDRVGKVRDGSEFLVDIKTGVAPAAVAIQLSAYAACLRHPRSRLRRCVELHSDSTYRVIPFETTDFQRDFDTFVRALETFRAVKEEK
jgi:hypothetical protein